MQIGENYRKSKQGYAFNGQMAISKDIVMCLIGDILS